MKISLEEMRHLAALSNLKLSEPELESLRPEIEQIIDYISQLQEVDTSDVAPTYQVFEMENIWRPDEVAPQDAEREALLNLAPESAEHQIKVPKVL